jgi:DivIVA domain-containing protein
MDELSPLFQEIEFHERYRGYDPDEVDAFVDRVARAAAEMRGRIAELHERVDAAEARGGGVGTHSDAEETLTRTLVLAQRTADAAIAEARQEADRMTADAATSAQAILSAAEAEAQMTLRDAQAEAADSLKAADDRAGLILAEAETDRRAMVAAAEAEAAEAASTERTRLAAEVSELHEYRAFLADDIEILERHLTEERHRLTLSLSALTDLLESPEAFRVARPPATSGVDIAPDVAESLAAAEAEIDAPADDSPVVAEDIVEPVEDIAEPVDETAADEAVVEETVLDAPVVEETVLDAPVVDESHPLTFAPVDDRAPEPTIDLVAAEAAAADIEESETEVVSEAADGEPGDDEPSEGRGDEVVYTEIDLADPGSGPEPGGGESMAEPAFAGMFEATLDAPVEPAPPRLVTAADLEPSTSGSRIGFETSSLDRGAGDGGPVTQAVPALQDGSLFAEPEMDDDPFLSQLRDAMEGEEMPRADDDALTAFFDQQDDDGGRSWFGRRR